MKKESSIYIVPKFGEFSDSELSDISVIHKNDDGSYNLVVDGKSYQAEIISYNNDAKKATIRVNGFKFDVEIKNPLDILVDDLGFNDAQVVSLSEFNAPMPGLVLDVMVKAGDQVSPGDNLVILEAMKMENILKATGSGVVDDIKVAKGEKVDKNQILLKFK